MAKNTQRLKNAQFAWEKAHGGYFGKFPWSCRLARFFQTSCQHYAWPAPLLGTITSIEAPRARADVPAEQYRAEREALLKRLRKDLEK